MSPHFSPVRSPSPEENGWCESGVNSTLVRSALLARLSLWHGWGLHRGGPHLGGTSRVDFPIYLLPSQHEAEADWSDMGGKNKLKGQQARLKKSAKTTSHSTHQLDAGFLQRLSRSPDCSTPAADS